jgi:hypothetical protein
VKNAINAQANTSSRAPWFNMNITGMRAYGSREHAIDGLCRRRFDIAAIEQSICAVNAVRESQLLANEFAAHRDGVYLESRCDAQFIENACIERVDKRDGKPILYDAHRQHIEAKSDRAWEPCCRFDCRAFDMPRHGRRKSHPYHPSGRQSRPRPKVGANIFFGSITNRKAET